MRPRRLAPLLLLAGLSGTVAVRAEEPPVKPPPARYYFRLDYRVAPGLRGCLSRPDLRELLAGQLDYDAIRQDDSPGQIVIDLSRQGGKVQARLVVDGAGEHWETTIDKASTCEDVTLDALVNINAAVTVLILIPMQEKLSAPAPPEAPPAPPPPPPPPPVAPPPCACTVAPPPLPPPPAPRVLPAPFRYELGLSAVFSAGTAPVVTGGVGWTVGVRWPQVSAAAEGRVLFSPPVVIEGYGTRDNYNFVYAAGSVVGCFYPWSAWVSVCIRGELGTLSSSLNSPPGRLTGNLIPLAGIGLRLGGERLLTRGLALRAYAEVLAEAQTGSLSVEKEGGIVALWPGSVVSGSIGIGPVMYFEGF